MNSSYTKFIDETIASMYSCYGIKPFKRLPRKKKKKLQKLKDRSHARQGMLQYQKEMDSFRKHLATNIEKAISRQYLQFSNPLLGEPYAPKK